MPTIRFEYGAGTSSTMSESLPLGHVITSEDVPATPDVNNFGFNCWSSDKNGFFPCDPIGYEVKGDTVFYGNYADKTLRFADEVNAIEKREGGVYAPPKNKIVFYGSSNFTLWPELVADMKPEVDALNHGIGGATNDMLMAHLLRLAVRYEPKLLVIQCSTNDINRFPEQVCLDMDVELLDMIRRYMPSTPLGFVSYMPIPRYTARWRDDDQLQRMNAFVKNLCETHENCYYMDIFDDIRSICEKHLAFEHVYFKDLLHYNREGQRVFCSVLKREIAKIPL